MINRETIILGLKIIGISLFALCWLYFASRIQMKAWLGVAKNLLENNHKTIKKDEQKQKEKH